MSFSVDLWNGFDIIKTQIFSVRKKMKVISKAISSYLAIDATYNKNLENLYKEFKEINNSEYMMDKSYIKILDIFEYENQNRKIISSYMNTLIMEPLNEYLRQPNILLNKCFSDNIYNEESFKRSLNLLKEKQINYWKDCKELSVLLAQNEMDEMNNTTGKIAKTRLSRINEKFLKLNASKQEYIDTINESNKEREKYNKKTEEILNTLEQIYTTMLSKLKEALTNFASQRNEFLQKIYNKEKMEYETIHVKVDPKKELFQFVSNNATKEFPMIKFEFCPLKYSILNQNIKNKCSKFPDTAFPKIYKSVKNFFEENKIFKEEALFRLNRRNTDFRSLFSKKSLRTDIELNKNDQKQNKEFIDKYITGLFMNKTQEKKDNEVKKDNNKKVENNSIKDNIEANKNNTGQNMKENIQSKEKDNKKENNKEDKNLQGSLEETKEKIKKIDSNNDKPETNETPKDDKNIIDNNTSQKSENIIKKESREIPNSKVETEEEDDQKKVIQNYFYSEHPNYLTNAETLIKRLSYLRSKGHFLIGEKAYNEILSLFFIILNQEQKNYYILKNVLILSQTFYKIKDNKKVYLQQGMKGSKVFMNPETWHRVINYSMNLSCSSMDLTQTKEDMIKKINKEANVIIMAYLCDIKQYTNDDEVFDEVKNYYVKVYNLDEEMINKEVENYMNSLNKNESSEQEKHMKIEEKIKNDDDVENDNDNNENNTNIDETINFIKQRSYSTPINIKENNNVVLKENKKNEIISIKENIKEENESEENNILNEIKEDKNQKEKNKIEIINNDKVENSENKNQIINNNINIIKIEAKEVIIVENNSKNNINIEKITSLKKDNKDIIKDNNNQKDDKKELNETNNNQIKKIKIKSNF